jgi:hypothetical protein
MEFGTTVETKRRAIAGPSVANAFQLPFQMRPAHRQDMFPP